MYLLYHVVVKNISGECNRYLEFRRSLKPVVKV